MICTSIGKTTLAECLDILKSSTLAEIRLDLNDFQSEDIKTVFSLPIPLIATCRPENCSDRDRLIQLKTAILAGAAYLDLEVDSSNYIKKELIHFAGLHNCKVIISYHNYFNTPDSDILNEMYGSCMSAGADLVKIACRTESTADAARIIALYNGRNNLIALGMGESGRITRIAAPLLGAPFTYAAVSCNQGTADGQFSVADLIKIYEMIKYE